MAIYEGHELRRVGRLASSVADVRSSHWVAVLAVVTISIVELAWLALLLVLLLRLA